MILALLDLSGAGHAVASGHDDRRRVLRDRGHQLRAGRRRSGLPRLKHASARSTCRTHARRAVEATSPQVTSGDYDTGDQIDGGLSCLANGERRPIAEIREGDMVLATDPETGESGPREVVATLPHTDQLLTLETSSGEIVTTEDHRYWNQTEQAWQESQDLDEGDQLLTADGDIVTVEGLDWTTVHTAPAYDLDIDDLHSFYVAAGDEAVLVHNCDVALGLKGSGDVGGIGNAGWVGAGLAGEGPFVSRFYQALYRSTSNGGRIRFNLDGLDLDRALAVNRFSDPFDVGVTNWELQQVLANPQFR